MDLKLPKKNRILFSFFVLGMFFIVFSFSVAFFEFPFSVIVLRGYVNKDSVVETTSPPPTNTFAELSANASEESVFKKAFAETFILPAGSYSFHSQLLQDYTSTRTEKFGVEFFGTVVSYEKPDTIEVQIENTDQLVKFYIGYAFQRFRLLRECSDIHDLCAGVSPISFLEPAFGESFPENYRDSIRIFVSSLPPGSKIYTADQIIYKEI